MKQTGVVVNRMHLSGEICHRDALLPSLEMQDWPGEDSENIILIRKIDVKGPWWRIGASAAAMARQLVADATHGAHATEDTDVVYFRNRAEQCVYLCRALLEGTHNRWYWQNVVPRASLSASMLSSILQENLFDLPEIFYQLNQQQLFSGVVMFIGDAAMADIYQQLRHLTQWQDFSVVSASGNASGATPVFYSKIPEKSITTSFQFNVRDASGTWKKTLDQLKHQGMVYDLSVALIKLLTAWKHYPHKMADSQFSNQWVEEFQKQLDVADTPIISGSGLQNVNSIQELDQEDRSATAGYASGTDRKSLSHHPSFKHADEDDRHNALSCAVSDVVAGVDETEIFITSQGGIFYLINALRMIGCTDTIQQSQLEPWAWIWLIAEQAGCVSDQGIAEFLARQLSIPLAEQELQPYRLSIDQCIQQLIHRFSAHLAWSKDFFSLTARIEQRDPYINVYFHSTSVQLTRRLLGLDVDPGWQPWLGQVVRFHYVNDPELADHPVMAGH